MRFNPDAYDDPATGARVPSCWGVGKDGDARVKPSREAEWAARLEKLAQVVAAYLVDHTDAWAAWDEADRPKPELHAIELFGPSQSLARAARHRALLRRRRREEERRDRQAGRHQGGGGGGGDDQEAQGRVRAPVVVVVPPRLRLGERALTRSDYVPFGGFKN